jgi:hypothetical protein
MLDEKARRAAGAWLNLPDSSSPPIPLLDGMIRNMVRTLHLEEWAGMWVAVDRHDRVVASAANLGDLIGEVDEHDLDVEIMRAPVPGEPLVFGLG